MQEEHGSQLNCLFSVYLLIIEKNATVCLPKHTKIKERLVCTCTVITQISAHEGTVTFFLNCSYFLVCKYEKIKPLCALNAIKL